MNIFEDFECKGKWWLPSNPEKMVSGVLVKKADYISLELIGSFENESSPSAIFEDEKDEPVIFGITSDAKKVSLMKCFRSSSLNFACPFPIVCYSCQTMVAGKYVSGLDEKVSCSASFTFPVLSHWCSPQNIKHGLSDRDEGKVEIILDLQQKSIVKVDIDDATTLEIKSSASYGSNRICPNINQSTYLYVTKKSETTYEELIDIGFQFKQFLSLACLEDIWFDEILLYDDAEVQDYGYTKAHKPVSVLFSWWSRHKPREKKLWDFLFDYRIIEVLFPGIITNWYKDYKTIAPIRGHLIESIKTPTVFSSVIFLSVVQALEGFYYRYRNPKETKRNLLQKLKDEFADIDKIKADDFDLAATCDSRDYYSHLLPEGKKTHVLDGFDLYYLTQKLRRLLICCILSLVGFEHDRINIIFKQTYNNYFKE